MGRIQKIQKDLQALQMLQTTTATNFIENWMLFCLLGKKNAEIISVRNKGPRKQILKILAQFQTEGGGGGEPQCYVTQNSKPRSACRVSRFHIPRIDIFQFFLLLHPRF